MTAQPPRQGTEAGAASDPVVRSQEGPGETARVAAPSLAFRGWAAAQLGIAAVIVASWSRLAGDDAPPGGAIVGMIGGALALALVGRSAVRRSGERLLDVGVAGLAVAALAAGTFGAGWANDRQNYWDAIHFAALIWAAGAGIALALEAAWTAGRAGLQRAGGLLGVAVVAALLWSTALLWTRSDTLQGWTAALARWAWGLTHR